MFSQFALDHDRPLDPSDMRYWVLFHSVCVGASREIRFTRASNVGSGNPVRTPGLLLPHDVSTREEEPDLLPTDPPRARHGGRTQRDRDGAETARKTNRKHQSWYREGDRGGDGTGLPSLDPTTDSAQRLPPTLLPQGRVGYTRVSHLLYPDPGFEHPPITVSGSPVGILVGSLPRSHLLSSTGPSVVSVLEVRRDPRVALGPGPYRWVSVLTNYSSDSTDSEGSGALSRPSSTARPL